MQTTEAVSGSNLQHVLDKLYIPSGKDTAAVMKMWTSA